MCFILHMHQRSPSRRFMDLKLLYDVQQIQEWPMVLLNQNYTTTSVKNMMLNASAFVTHIKIFYPEMSSLSNAQFKLILLQFKKLQKNNSRKIKAHQHPGELTLLKPEHHTCQLSRHGQGKMLIKISIKPLSRHEYHGNGPGPCASAPNLLDPGCSLPRACVSLDSGRSKSTPQLWT
ncbi:hypothetical protein AOLI_G00297640 [Acnodon oligacanthus]